jgi:hypothetical protein
VSPATWLRAWSTLGGSEGAIVASEVTGGEGYPPARGEPGQPRAGPRSHAPAEPAITLTVYMVAIVCRLGLALVILQDLEVDVLLGS